MNLRDLLPPPPHEGPPVPRFLLPKQDEEKKIPVQAALTGQVSTAETIAYQNRELTKTLLTLEAHLTQGCRIDGKPCNCCSNRHPLELEKLSEEALSMTSKPVYKDIIEFAREVEEKANEAAVESRIYEGEYPGLAIRARDLRLDLAKEKAQQALELIKQGEIPLGP